jgi:ABC-type uncharacterized transport system involved in gliding motility auxiliary subunit
MPIAGSTDMDLNHHTRLQLRLQGWLFTLLLLLVLILLGWLSNRYYFQADWTAAGRHTLSEASVEVLRQLDGPLQITSFTRAELSADLRQRSVELVERYQQHKPDIELVFVDPDREPEKVREWGVTAEGELVLTYRGQRENLRTLGEQALTNALARMLRSERRLVVFLSGHGERRFDGRANHDLGQWASQLAQKGFVFQAQNLAVDPQLPQETAVLVIASPQQALQPGEVARLREYVAGGGNLLWLSEPGESVGLGELAEQLDLHFIPGTLIDPAAQMLGIDNPAFVIVAEYPAHPLSRGLEALTVFPHAHAMQHYSDSEWESFPLLNSQPRSWSESGPLDGELRFDEHQDTPGPLSLGLLLERPLTNGEGRQRVAVIGDGDFLSNSFLGNGANQGLGDRLLNWLSHDDHFISIAPRTSPDTRFELGRVHTILIGFGFLVVLPGLLLALGLGIWWRRRKR